MPCFCELRIFFTCIPAILTVSLCEFLLVTFRPSYYYLESTNLSSWYNGALKWTVRSQAMDHNVLQCKHQTCLLRNFYYDLGHLWPTSPCQCHYTQSALSALYTNESLINVPPLCCRAVTCLYNSMDPLHERGLEYWMGEFVLRCVLVLLEKIISLTYQKVFYL